MNPRTISSAAFVLGAVLALASPSVTLGAMPTEQEITAAKTTADHEAIAVQYDQLAEEADAKAKMHQDMAETYKRAGTGPATGKSIGNDFQVLVTHCQALVKKYREEAASYAALAKEHRAIGAKLK